MTDLTMTVPDDILPQLATAIRSAYPDAAKLSDTDACYYYVWQTASNILVSYAASQAHAQIQQQVQTAQDAASTAAQRITKKGK